MMTSECHEILQYEKLQLKSQMFAGMRKLKSMQSKTCDGNQARCKEAYDDFPSQNNRRKKNKKRGTDLREEVSEPIQRE